MGNDHIITAVGTFEGKSTQRRIVVKPIPQICSGYWTDKNNKKITNALLLDTVRYHVLTQGINNGSKLELTLMDDDGIFFSDDMIYSTNIEINENRGYMELEIPHFWLRYIDDDLGDAIELYGKCKYQNVVKQFENEILNVRENGEIVTVFVELPYSSTTDKLGRKGLAGHTAIMIDREFYDYGPTPGMGADLLGSEGRPWWDSENLTKKDFMDVMDSEKQRTDWQIIGECFCIDIHITQKECIKIQKWWEEKYKDLGRYSVYIVNGDQCTTTVRKSLEESTDIFDFLSFPGITQTPRGLVELLTKHAKHTCGEKKGQSICITKTYKEI